MQILLTGATGFIGHVLSEHLLLQGHGLTILTRSPEKVTDLNVRRPENSPAIKAITAIANLQRGETFDAIINLAGEAIADKRWSKKQKSVLLQSRLGITQRLIDFCQQAQHKPTVLISASAIGVYGEGIADSPIDENHSDENHNDENNGGDDSFASALCKEWEACAQQAHALGIRTCILRFGIVLGNNGGALKKMLPPFKLGLGGKIGSGKQWMPWIHRDDLINIILRVLDDKSMEGAYNCTAPEPVKNERFSRTLAKCLNRPALLPFPAFAVQLLFGEMGQSLLLEGKNIVPSRLQKAGFQFKYSELEPALKNILCA